MATYEETLEKMKKLRDERAARLLEQPAPEPQPEPVPK